MTSGSNSAVRYMMGCGTAEEPRQRQLKWGRELIEEERPALRGAAAPCDLLSNSAARYVSEQRRALWDSLFFVLFKTPPVVGVACCAVEVSSITRRGAAATARGRPP